MFFVGFLCFIGFRIIVLCILLAYLICIGVCLGLCVCMKVMVVVVDLCCVGFVLIA